LLSVVAEDHLRAVVRQAATEARCRGCYEALDLSAGLEAAAELRPELCVLDVTLVDDVTRALQRVVSSSSRTRVVVIAADGGDEGFLDAIAGGARGYLTADVAAPSLARALEEVLADYVSVPRRLLGVLVDQVAADRRGPGQQR
jgi:DNA-binding NarL/FixJ family response regulator